MGKVKAELTWRALNLKEAGPSLPVEVLGFDSNSITVMILSSLKVRLLQEKYLNIVLIKNKNLKNTVSKSNVEEMFAQINKGIGLAYLYNKTDVQGSAEAIENSITKPSNNSVKVKVL